MFYTSLTRASFQNRSRVWLHYEFSYKYVNKISAFHHAVRKGNVPEGYRADPKRHCRHSGSQTFWDQLNAVNVNIYISIISWALFKMWTMVFCLFIRAVQLFNPEYSTDNTRYAPRSWLSCFSWDLNETHLKWPVKQVNKKTALIMVGCDFHQCS